MKLSSFLIAAGYGAVVIGITLLLFIFYPVIQNELSYFLLKSPDEPHITLDTTASKSTDTFVPVDTDFGIIIPKIGANTKVIPQVDPYNASDYQQALAQGVAHAKGTATPDSTGNTFIFSHSSVNFYEASRYNSIFYLLHKLEDNDDIFLVYKNKVYQYQVTNSQIVDPSQISYLNQFSPQPTLTLMTCWPPGTTFKRLIVTAKQATPKQN